MWWVILVIFFTGLALSALTFTLQYLGYCPVNGVVWTPAGPGSAPGGAVRQQLRRSKKDQPGLPKNVAERLASYTNVNEIPHRMEAIMESFTEQGECLICQEEMPSKKISQLPCGHIYHKECIVAWLQRKPTCPSCRTVITEGNLNSRPLPPGGTIQDAPDIEMGMAKN